MLNYSTDGSYIFHVIAKIFIAFLCYTHTCHLELLNFPQNMYLYRNLYKNLSRERTDAGEKSEKIINTILFMSMLVNKQNSV